MNLKQVFTKLKEKLTGKSKPKSRKLDMEAISSESIETRISSKKNNAIETWKFSEEQKLLIVSLIARCMKPSEIIRECQDHYGLKVSTSQIVNYRNAEKWKPVIKKLRQEYLENLEEVAGSHKKVRLDRADRIFEKAVNKGDLKNALSAVEHQRKEMEEKGANFNLVLNQYNTMSDDELEARRMELVKKISPKQVIDITQNGGTQNGKVGNDGGVQE